jgi:hypothetical protein
MSQVPPQEIEAPNVALADAQDVAGFDDKERLAASVRGGGVGPKPIWVCVREKAGNYPPFDMRPDVFGIDTFIANRQVLFVVVLESKIGSLNDLFDRVPRAVLVIDVA